MIEIREVSKWYGSFQALADCSTHVAKGEVVVVCGPSGSGKSTLIKCVNGLEPFQKGEVIGDGISVGDPGTDLGGNWRVIVLNDNHNTFDHVAHTLARTIPGVSVAKGYAIADVIHTTGRAIVWSGVKETAELYWEQLQQAGLTMAPLEPA